jgi:hypothetical protein
MTPPEPKVKDAPKEKKEKAPDEPRFDIFNIFGPGKLPDVKPDGPLATDQLADLIKLLPVKLERGQFVATKSPADLRAELTKLQEKFDAVIKAADQPLPPLKLGALLKQADKLAADYDKTIKPGDKIITEKDQAIARAVLAIKPPADQEKFKATYLKYFAEKDPDRKAALRKILAGIDEDALKLCEQRDELLKPYRTTRDQLDALRLEFNQPGTVRYRYAQLLSAAGDADGARAMILDAYRKNLDPRLRIQYRAACMVARVPKSDLRTPDEQYNLAVNQTYDVTQGKDRSGAFDALDEKDQNKALGLLLDSVDKATVAKSLTAKGKSLAFHLLKGNTLDTYALLGLTDTPDKSADFDALSERDQQKAFDLLRDKAYDPLQYLGSQHKSKAYDLLTGRDSDKEFSALSNEDKRKALAPCLAQFDRARKLADAELKDAEKAVGKSYDTVLTDLKKNADTQDELVKKLVKLLTDMKKDNPDDFTKYCQCEELVRKGGEDNLKKAETMAADLMKKYPDLTKLQLALVDVQRDATVLHGQLEYLERFHVAKFRIDEKLCAILYEIATTAGKDYDSWIKDARKVLSDGLDAVPEAIRADLCLEGNVQALKTSLRLIAPELQSSDRLLALGRESVERGDFAQARLDFEQAAKNADGAYTRPEKVREEIERRLKILEEGKYTDENKQEVKIGPNDILKIHDEIEALIQRSRAPMQTRCAYAVALMEQGYNKDAEKVWKEAIKAADNIPVDLIKKVGERLRTDRDSFPRDSQQWQTLHNWSLEDQERARARTDIRYTVAMFYIAGGQDEEGTPLGKIFKLSATAPHVPTAQTWDRILRDPNAAVNKPVAKKGDETYPGEARKDEIERAKDTLSKPIGDKPFCNAKEAFDLLNEVVVITKKMDGIDLDKEPGLASDKMKALRRLIHANADENLKEKMKTHGGFWKNAASDGTSAVVGMVVTVGLFALTKGRSGVAATTLRYSAIPLGMSASVGTRYAMMRWVYGDEDESFMNSTIHGVGSYAAAGALILTKKGMNKLFFSAFTEERVGELAYSALKAQKAARVAAAGEVLGAAELATASKAEPTVAELAKAMTDKGYALPPKLATAAKAADAGTTLLTKELAGELLGASGQQGANLLRKLFKGTKLLETEAAALAQADKLAVQAWDRVPYLGMKATRIPGFLGYQARALSGGYVASLSAQTISTISNATDDWYKGKKYADDTPINPLTALDRRTRPYDSNGKFDPYMLLDNMWVQSAVMAPFVGYARPARPLYQSPFAAYTEARAAGSGKLVASTRFAGNLFLHQPYYFAWRWPGDALRGAGPSVGALPSLEGVLAAGWQASAIEGLNPFMNPLATLNIGANYQAERRYRDLLGKKKTPENPPEKQGAPPWLPDKK